jgi:hypothetical protein
LEDIKKLFNQVANAKVITLIIVGIFVGILIWKNSDFISEVSITIKNDKNTEIAKKTSKENQKKKSHLQSDLTISDILLPPHSEKLPSIIVIEINNIGKASALNVKINIDLGIAKIIEYEVIGFSSDSIPNNLSQTSIINISLKEIRPKENGYIYLHTNAPIFKNISISSKDIEKIYSISLREYLQKNNTAQYFKGPTISGTLEVMTIFFMWVMGIYFTLLLIAYISSKTKLFEY